MGSLDQLLSLNELASKLDAQLDIACKRYEKLCKDNGNGIESWKYTEEVGDGSSTVESKYLLSLPYLV